MVPHTVTFICLALLLRCSQFNAFHTLSYLQLAEVFLALINKSNVVPDYKIEVGIQVDAKPMRLKLAQHYSNSIIYLLRCVTSPICDLHLPTNSTVVRL